MHNFGGGARPGGIFGETRVREWGKVGGNEEEAQRQQQQPEQQPDDEPSQKMRTRWRRSVDLHDYGAEAARGGSGRRAMSVGARHRRSVDFSAVTVHRYRPLGDTPEEEEAGGRRRGGGGRRRSASAGENEVHDGYGRGAVTDDVEAGGGEVDLFLEIAREESSPEGTRDSATVRSSQQGHSAGVCCSSSISLYSRSRRGPVSFLGCMRFLSRSLVLSTAKQVAAVKKSLNHFPTIFSSFILSRREAYRRMPSEAWR